jgi:hypothetical protein
MNNINQIERDAILEMHSKFKKSLISEQVDTDLKTKLNKILSDGCVKNGKIVQLQTKNPALQYAIKQESTKTPGKFRYFFADNRVGIFDANNKFQFSPSKWSCAGVQQANIQAANDIKLSADTADTSLVKQEGGWQEAKDIKTTRENLENPLMFEKKVVNGVTLYRSVPGSGIAGGLTPDQIVVIKKWHDKGGKLRKELDPEEAKTWSSRVVSPASEGYFSQDLIMYFSPENFVGSNGGKIEDEFKKAISSQTPSSKRDCKDTIEAYYQAYVTKKKIQPNVFEPMKEKVQACANEFNGKWGGILSRIDNYVDILRGVREGGPTSYGDDSKWRIQ